MYCRPYSSIIVNNRIALSINIYIHDMSCECLERTISIERNFTSLLRKIEFREYQKAMERDRIYNKWLPMAIKSRNHTSDTTEKKQLQNKQDPLNQDRSRAMTEWKQHQARLQRAEQKKSKAQFGLPPTIWRQFESRMVELKTIRNGQEKHVT